LIEVLIVLAIVTVGLVALISGVTVSLGNTSFAKQSVRANHEAQRIMERVRSYKEKYGSWCLPEGCVYNDKLPKPVDYNICPPTSGVIPLENENCSDWAWSNGPRIKIEGAGDVRRITVTERWGGACDGVGACHQAEVKSFVNKWSREW